MTSCRCSPFKVVLFPMSTSRLCVCLFFLSLVLLSIAGTEAETRSDYVRQREVLIQQEKAMYFNASMILTDKERKVSQLLHYFRQSETLANPSFFPPQHNFRLAKPYIDNTSRLLKTMPKGGILHIHTIGDTRNLIQKATYRPDCYININKSSASYGEYHFSPTGKTLPNDGSVWKNVVQWRSEVANATALDEALFDMLQFYSPMEPDCVETHVPMTSSSRSSSSFDAAPPIPKPFTPGACMSEDEMWVYFDNTWGKIGSMQAYLPVFKQTVRFGLQQLVDDNIQYVELRLSLGSMYDENGTIYTHAQELQIWLDTLAEFNAQSSRKISLKFIYSSLRRFNPATIYEQMLDCLALQQQFPSQLLGYDLVDQEDRFHSLYYYVDDFLKIQTDLARQGKPPLKFFFHAGETDWNNRYNLYDAFLLNTTRIGHGFAMAKYPKLLELARQGQVAVEICPISNQMLLLLLDMRTHPAVTLMHQGVPIVLSPDGPTIYGYAGVSYDYYEAYMSWDLDISSLKQISQNSLRYSGMSQQEKQVAIKEWQQSWDLWIDSVLHL